MRLSSEELLSFINVLSKFVKDGEGTLYLYGSRTNDSLKGGDIDLLLILTHTFKAEQINSLRPEIVNGFKKELGDRIIDFTAISKEELETNTFFNGILPSAIPLKIF